MIAPLSELIEIWLYIPPIFYSFFHFNDQQLQPQWQLWCCIIHQHVQCLNWSCTEMVLWLHLASNLTWHLLICFYWWIELGWTYLLLKFQLTHLPHDKMAAISQMMFSDAFSWMKSFVFCLKFHWSLFLRVQVTIPQHWLGDGLVPNRWQAIIWTNADLIQWHIYAALGVDVLN